MSRSAVGVLVQGVVELAYLVVWARVSERMREMPRLSRCFHAKMSDGSSCTIHVNVVLA